MSTTTTIASWDWGQATWIFLHVMAQAVDARLLAENHVFRTDLFEKIQRICDHLPCPECRTHAAKETHHTIKWATIRTKFDLIWMIHSFHNRVNARTGKRLFNVNNVLATYQPRIHELFTPTGILATFQLEFSKPIRDLSFQQDNLVRDRVAKEVSQWFLIHKDSFQELS